MALKIIDEGGESRIREEVKSFVRRFIRKLIILVICFSVAAVIVKFAVQKVKGMLFDPADENDNTEILVEIEMGTSVSGIATKLYESGVIASKMGFKLSVDMQNANAKLKAGKYALNKSMTYTDIIDLLIVGKSDVDDVTITIPEGKKLYQIAQYLEEDAALPFTAQEFIDACKVEDWIGEFSFLSDIPEDRRETEYAMEGYLFPDTYRVYVDATPEQIIRKMLKQFDAVYTEDLREETNTQGYTIDEVVTLASVVQAETRLDEEFPRVAAVYSNRINCGMLLQADATVRYSMLIMGVEGYDDNSWSLSASDLELDEGHNTYKYQVPSGPICSPGKLAIESVLEPNEDDIANGMLYYVLKDPETGEQEFNATYEAHQAATAKYKPIWEAYQASLAESDD